MRTLLGDNPDALRRGVLRRIRTAADADYAVWFTVREVAGDYYYSPLLCEGDSQAPEVWQGVAGRPAAATLQSGIRYPRPEERRGFQPIDRRALWEGCEDPADFEARRRFYEPRSIGDEARMLVYRGQSFLGWIGVFRWKDRAGFDADALSSLNGQVQRVQAELTSADCLEQKSADPREMYLVMTPAGQITHASEHAAPWLDRDRRETLATLIKLVDRQDEVPPVRLFEHHELRLSRLDGSGGPHYMVHLIPTPPPTIPADAILTPTQREIADYAVSGATAKEIARTTGRSPNTVRYHLKNIYERLGVGSRVELAMALSES